MSLVTALADVVGHHLFRINLSDQTDIIDPFGSDLPLKAAVRASLLGEMQSS